MSHIPNSAMPHAGTINEDDQDEMEGRSLSERAGDLAGRARENPAAMFAFGAAAAAGAIAAAMPFFRSDSGNSSRRSGSSGSNSSSSGSRAKSGTTARTKSGTGTTAKKASGTTRSRSKKTSS